MGLGDQRGEGTFRQGLPISEHKVGGALEGWEENVAATAANYVTFQRYTQCLRSLATTGEELEDVGELEETSESRGVLLL